MEAVAKLASDPPVFWPRSVVATTDLPAGQHYRTPMGMVRAFQLDPLRYFTAAFRTFGDVVCFRSWPFKS
jgi:hypothetical protein